MITETYIKFFQELKENNDREWFDINRKRYENEVRAPFIALVAQLLAELKETIPELPDDPKKTLFRINRDIRFSKDKSPYNLWMSAAIAPGGKKSNLPAFYLQINANTIHVGGGLYNIGKDTLGNIRGEIYVNPKAFESIIQHPDFVQTFGEILGERNKRLDPDYKELAEKLPAIANKQFYAMATHPTVENLNQELPKFLMHHFHAVRPLNEYLTMAME